MRMDRETLVVYLREAARSYEGRATIARAAGCTAAAFDFETQASNARHFADFASVAIAIRLEDLTEARA